MTSQVQKYTCAAAPWGHGSPLGHNLEPGNHSNMRNSVMSLICHICMYVGYSAGVKAVCQLIL